jgi:hypothetical protein
MMVVKVELFLDYQSIDSSLYLIEICRFHILQLIYTLLDPKLAEMCKLNEILKRILQLPYCFQNSM